MMERCDECGKIQWKPTINILFFRVWRKLRPNKHRPCLTDAARLTQAALRAVEDDLFAVGHVDRSYRETPEWKALVESRCPLDEFHAGIKCMIKRQWNRLDKGGQVMTIRMPPWPKFCDGPPYTQKDLVE